MANKYKLLATGTNAGKLPELSAFIAERKSFKDDIWMRRNNKLVDMSEKLDKLISLYRENYGASAHNVQEKALFYKSALAHQIWNTLMATKLYPDFIDFSPLGVTQDTDLLQKAEALTQAHRLIRYKGSYTKACMEAKPDFIWGNAFIEMSTRYDGDTAVCTEYTHAPFREMRNYYGDTDIMRVIDYPIGKYAEIYGEPMLKKVALGGITSNDQYNTQNQEEKSFDSQKDTIQVVRSYDPARLMFAEIHGGNGYIYKHLTGKDYPFMKEDGTGYAPFKESRFYEEPNGDYFGWGVFDYIIPLANLETTITNATAMEAIWDASAPSFLYTSDPQDMEQKIKKHFRNINKGVNMPIVQKDTGLGTKGQMQPMRKGVDNNNMQIWDETTVNRATRFTNVDVRALSEYAPTAEQQKLKKIEADKLNIRVLLTNEEREKEFAMNEVEFIKNGKTRFHNYEIEIVDEVAEELRTETGYMPAAKIKIKDILKDVKDLELKIVPRLEGVLDDMNFMEIQTIQEDLQIIQPGTAAYDIAMEKYFAKKNPDWGLKRMDFSTPSQPAEPEVAPEGDMAGVEPQGMPSPTDALTAQL